MHSLVKHVPCRTNHARKCMVCGTRLTSKRSNTFLCSAKCWHQWTDGVVFIDIPWKMKLVGSNGYFCDLYSTREWSRHA